jgi:hypothetical protein
MDRPQPGEEKDIPRENLTFTTAQAHQPIQTSSVPMAIALGRDV